MKESVDLALVHGQTEHKFNWVSGHWGERSRTRAGKPLVIQSYAARAGKGVFGRVWSKKHMVFGAVGAGNGVRGERRA